MMNKNLLSCSLLSGLLLLPLTGAATHTLTLGTAQSRITQYNHLRGINLKYRYEWDSALSLMTSVSWLKSVTDVERDRGYLYHASHTKLRQYSVLAGPAWRANQWLSIYALAGAAVTKAEKKWVNVFVAPIRLKYEYKHTDSSRSVVPVAALGVQLTPLKYLALDLSYEFSRPMILGDHVRGGAVTFSAGISF